MASWVQPLGWCRLSQNNINQPGWLIGLPLAHWSYQSSDKLLWEKSQRLFNCSQCQSISNRSWKVRDEIGEFMVDIGPKTVMIQCFCETPSAAWDIDIALKKNIELFYPLQFKVTLLWQPCYVFNKDVNSSESFLHVAAMLTILATFSWAHDCPQAHKHTCRGLKVEHSKSELSMMFQVFN